MHIKQTLNQLGRSKQDQMIGGVCAGFAEVTDTPPWVWRAGFLISVLAFGAAVLIYAILWITMPLRSDIA